MASSPDAVGQIFGYAVVYKNRVSKETELVYGPVWTFANNAEEVKNLAIEELVKTYPTYNVRACEVIVRPF